MNDRWRPPPTACPKLNRPNVSCIMSTPYENTLITNTIYRHLGYAHPHITDINGTQAGRTLFALYSGHRVHCEDSWEALLNAHRFNDRWPYPSMQEGHARAAPFHEAFESCVRSQLPSSWKWAWNSYSTNSYAQWTSVMDDVFVPPKNE
jgi:hypothetical protein